MTPEDAERLAREHSIAARLDDRPRCDPRTMAVAYCGLQLAPWPGAIPRLVNGVIWYPSDCPVTAQVYYVGHETGHNIVEHEGLRLDPRIEELVASRIGVAITLPGVAYARDVEAFGWDLPLLARLWPLASAWVHARRIVELSQSELVLSRWTTRGCSTRLAPDGFVGTTAIERSLARMALHGDSANAGPRLRAWPDDGSAIVLCGADELIAHHAHAWSSSLGTGEF